MINREVAHQITVPLPGVIYSFHPDGRVFADGKRHLYFSREEIPQSKEISHRNHK
jgi:hypothetical protein